MNAHMDAQKVLEKIRSVDRLHSPLHDLGFWRQCDWACGNGTVPKFVEPTPRLASNVRAIRIELRANLIVELVEVNGQCHIEATFAPWVEAVTTQSQWAIDQAAATRILNELATPRQAVVVH